MAKKIIVLVVIVLAVVAFIERDSILSYFGFETKTINSSEVKLLLRETPTLSSLIETLIENEVIENGDEFRDYVVTNKIDSTDFAAGKYVILSGTKLSNLVNGFVKNEEGHGNAEVKVKVVFNRCRTIEDVGSNISKCILADSASIVEYIKSEAALKKYGFTVEQIPALFIPEEYEMYFDTDAEGFVAFMAERFKEFWTSERYAKLKSVGLNSPSQAVTVASIVYSEQSQMSEEWPIIAKLYLNRINQGILLQSDPTFKFCWGDKLDGVEQLLNVHKAIDCPYNTYKYAGLPPGPICIPPAQVVDAVLNPADVNFLFMCGKPGGQGHNFSVTYADHQKNVAEYRVWLRKYLKSKNN